MSELAMRVDRVLDLAEMAYSNDASEKDVIELDSILQADRESRNRYVDYCWMHVALRLQLRARRATQNAHAQIKFESIVAAVGDSDVVKTEPSSSPAPAFLPTPSYGTTNYFADGWPVAYLLAAVILGLGIVAAAVTYVSQPVPVASSLPAVRKSRSVSGTRCAVRRPHHRHGRLQTAR